jgi:sporulation protein YlmC with PRC-barrel domain
MPHYGSLRATKFEDAEDIRGSEVYGVNGEKLGEIDDVIFDHTTGDIRYVVVDTGGWLSSRKFLVPASQIQPYGHDGDKFYADLDKERIGLLPQYDERRLKSESDWYDYEKRYEEGWKNGVVMYNERTGRIIAPPQEEAVQGARTSRLGEEGNLSGPAEPLEGSRVPDTEGFREPGVYRVEAVPEQEKRSDLDESLNANYGPRFMAFQKKVRDSRARVIGECPLCGSQEKVA